MVTKRIQADYDCLQEMLKAFMRHADVTAALKVQVEGLIDQLQGGAWRGVGDDQIDNKDIAQGPYIPGGVRP